MEQVARSNWGITTGSPLRFSSSVCRRGQVTSPRVTCHTCQPSPGRSTPRRSSLPTPGTCSGDGRGYWEAAVNCRLSRVIKDLTFQLGFDFSCNPRHTQFMPSLMSAHLMSILLMTPGSMAESPWPLPGPAPACPIGSPSCWSACWDLGHTCHEISAV